MSDAKTLKETLKYFKEENAELRKDKARLDFLLSENHPLAIEIEITHGWDQRKLDYLCDRESIDKVMENYK
jgi:hypothetical protein